MVRVQRERPDFVAGLLERVRADGPLRAAQLDEARPHPPGSMWNWHAGKAALEYLFGIGRITAQRILAREAGVAAAHVDVRAGRPARQRLAIGRSQRELHDALLGRRRRVLSELVVAEGELEPIEELVHVGVGHCRSVLHHGVDEGIEVRGRDGVARVGGGLDT